jgi:Zn-finger nucleic acid-binding protein
VCPRCQGVWIEQAEVNNLVQKLLVPRYTEADELLAEWEVAEHTGTLPSDFWKEDTLECPKGHGSMGKHYYGGSHIGVDQCQECYGFWLDGGELKAIAREITPDPLLESAWQELMRDQREFREKIKELELLPATIASYFIIAKSIPMMFAIAGALVIKVIVQGVIKADQYRSEQTQ